MKIMVSGSSGLIGSALVDSLMADKCDVIRLSREMNEKIDFSGVDAVIHLAGESIADGRWSASKKQRIRDSRISGTSKLAELISSSSTKPGVFISASAIGYYGDRGDELLTEDQLNGTDYLSEVCTAWEQAAGSTEKNGVRTAYLRTGIVLDSHGGALNKMLTPFKFGGGGILGNGKQYMSWISLKDMVSAIRFIIENHTLEGPVNLTAPNPVTNYEFTKTLGTALKRPTILPLPAFAARIIFGEMADALLLSSARVFPKKLQDAGYGFRHPELKSALEDILT